MARKNPMQDIVPKGRSIRNIPLKEGRESALPKAPRKKEITQAEIKERQREIEREKELRKDVELKQVAEKQLEEDIVEEKEEIREIEEDRAQKEAIREAREEFEETRTKRTKRAQMRNKTIAYALGAVVVVVGLAALVTSVFHSATITVTPRTLAFTADGDFTAKKNPSGSDLPFQVVSLTETASETVHATGEKQVTTRASGTIIIYNNYSTAPQRLIKNTRFATPEGLIFRITDSVTVPGKKGTTPGSIEATVLADEAGTQYNVGLKDFTIPGFKGDPRYNGFYARSKTPLAGGFSGVQKIVSDSDRAKAKSDIESKLAADLVKQAMASKKDGQVTFDKAYTVDYTALPDEASGDQVTIKEQGVISAAIFDQKDISTALADEYIKGYNGDPVIVPDFSSLVFTPKDFKPASSDSITFHLAGNASFEWIYDENALKNALKGQSRGNTPSILQKFPMIEKADISIRPFWSRSFPDSVGKITVKKAI
ncbi:MAG TPA: hypothetical protein VFT82_03155 [Candidatus Paceibacterota bacterium]|nr:hypothetical protein [Candidatus Paceibacterota bacterium]